MNIIIIFLIALGIAIDTCLIAIAKGLIIDSPLNRVLIISAIFGGFQAIMTLIGWLIGTPLQTLVSTLATLFAFLLILIIGIKLIYASLTDNGEEKEILILKDVIILVITTSIDAIAVGMSFALLNNPIIYPALIIGFTAFIFSLILFYIGRGLRFVFGTEIRIFGGLLLIVIGLLILI